LTLNEARRLYKLYVKIQLLKVTGKCVLQSARVILCTPSIASAEDNGQCTKYVTF